MARKKKNNSLTMLILRPFYLIPYCIKFLFLLMFEMIKFPFLLVKELFQSSYKRKTKDATGYDYEQFIAKYLRSCGYTNVTVTSQSGDYGVDVIARKGRNRYAIQCKYYSNPVGVHAVQEVVGGMAHYGCNKAMVVTNNEFTESAKKLASENGVSLKPHIEIGRTNRWKTIKLFFMIVSCLLMVDLVYDISKTGFNGISVEKYPVYLFILLMFFSLILSYILPKLALHFKLNRINVELQKVEKDISAIEHEAVKSPKKTVLAENDYKDRIIIDPNETLENQITAYILQTNTTSISQIQRRFKIGFQKTYDILENLEDKGIIGPYDPKTTREIRMSYSDWIAQNQLHKLSR